MTLIHEKNSIYAYSHFKYNLFRLIKVEDSSECQIRSVKKRMFRFLHYYKYVYFETVMRLFSLWTFEVSKVLIQHSEPCLTGYVGQLLQNYK